MKTVFIIILITFVCNVFAGDAENNLLKKRAFRLRAQRQYEKAAKLHEMVLENDPNDAENVFHLILILIQTSKLEKAEKLLNRYKEQMLAIQRIQLELMLALQRSEFSKAEKISNEYLESLDKHTKDFGIIARIFEQYRQHDLVIKIYMKARKISGDDYFFSRELANSYFSAQKYNNAVNEYIKLVQQKNHYSLFVLNKFKEMLKSDEQVIDQIRSTAGISEDPNIRELYALSLGEIKEFNKALEVYSSLPNEKLLKYAERMLQNGNRQIAIEAYDTFLLTSNDNTQKAAIMIKLAQIYIAENDLEKAEKILLEIYSNDGFASKRNRYRTKANRQCRELLAEISLMRQASINKVLKFLNEAKKYTYNKNDRNEVELKIVHLHMMDQKIDLAKQKLSDVLANENSSSSTFKKGYYYSYLIAIMTNDASADSLLSELLVTIPEDQITNDALKLFQIVNFVQDQKDRESLLKAYRKRSLFRFDESLRILEAVYQNTKNEDILFLAGEWALEFGFLDKAKEIFRSKFENPDLQQYAVLKLTEIETESLQTRDLSTSFLKDHPQSIFAPHFRRILAD